ncbi:MAG: PfkB family carbohydrate kinase [Chloroflexota bacterium]
MTVVCMGELLIDFVANESGVTVGEASGFEKKPGGAPANVAVAVARLGMSAGFMGQVGTDPFGDYLIGVLQDENVDTSALTQTSEARTMLAFVSLAAEGERSFMFYRHPSADMLMTADSMRLDVLDEATAFHFGSITMISEPAKSATLAAAKAARDKGLFVSYDPNLRRALWPSDEAAREGMLAGFAYADIVKVSEEELEFLGGDVEALMTDQTKLIVVTAGAMGATAYLRDGSLVGVTGYSVTPVDTTGAGDAFVAGLLVGILENTEDEAYLDKTVLQDLLMFANACGAQATTGRGAIPSLPTREQVEAMVSGGA